MELTKPLIGEPCNGCGLCCKLAVCHTGAFMMGMVKHFGEKRINGPCPALTPHNGAYGCGLLINPVKWVGKSKYRPEVISKHVAVCISAGTGCDEIGTDDMYSKEEDDKLTDIINKMSTDAEWLKRVSNSVEVLQKIKFSQ